MILRSVAGEPQDQEPALGEATCEAPAVAPVFGGGDGLPADVTDQIIGRLGRAGVAGRYSAE